MAAALEQAGLLVTTRREKNGWIAWKPGCDDAMRAVVRPLSLPADRRVHVISDIHGNLPFLKAC